MPTSSRTPRRLNLRRLSLALATLLSIATLASAIWAARLWTQAHNNLPPLPDLHAWNPDLPTQITTADGWPLTSHASGAPLAYEELPPLLIASVLAAEDEDFFLHRGYSPRAIARAALVNLRAGDIIQGASTITQQVAKHFLSSRKTTRRKLEELLLARQLEAHYSKPEILAAYLRNVYFGQQAWGISRASWRYFNLAPAELSLGQMATLAGLLPAPSVYNPVASPDIALQKRNRVLRRLHDIGVISTPTYLAERAQPLGFGGLPTAQPDHHLSFPEAHTEARQHIERLHPGTDWSLSGTRVITTHRVGLQAAARQALAGGILAHNRRQGYHGALASLANDQQLPALLNPLPDDARYSLASVQHASPDGLAILTPLGPLHIPKERLSWLGGLDPRSGRPRDPRAFQRLLRPDDLVLLHRTSPRASWELFQPARAEGALLLLDHHSGDLTATVGAHQVHRSAFNRATRACRQPGSLFKTIVFAEALSNSLTLATLLRDIPSTVDTRGNTGTWAPRNADLDFKGTITALDALVLSRNIPAVHLLERMGPSALIRRARALGVEATLDPTASLALGASCVTPLDMARVHAAIARGGLDTPTRAIDRTIDLRTGQLHDHGHFASPSATATARLARIAAPLLPPERVLNPRPTALLHHALLQVARRGTAAAIPDAWPIAAKTGTTNEFDAWLATYSPTLTAIVWIGSDKNTHPLGRGEHGARTALPVFTSLYQHLHRPDIDWPHRTLDLEEVLIDPATGLRSRPGEPGHPYPFIPGTAPAEFAPTRASRQLLHIDTIR
ncbi:hypothetical protein DL240_00810 [Lujinxingia litoralis]|uniref:peptidoglycan glycosyltransferase n=1 Tax=Lujinxingia litoralis TaxID=2211119 RepID=A0A328CDL4_9DELT|nr:transglycosylase domain-containing protein [Lujinxingia litoralis]RAL24783.1 hypothetical protein DL240_00810 [Lujinxingia litoralis]